MRRSGQTRQKTPKTGEIWWLGRECDARASAGVGSLWSGSDGLRLDAPLRPSALPANDPYEATNRQTLRLNGKIDRYFVVPTVALYFVLVPDGGRRAVHNLLGNLSLPTIFVNDMLQGEVKRGVQTAGAAC